MNHHNDYQGWEEREPEELKMALQNIRDQPLPTESLRKAIAKAESISMTPQAWKRGFLNALLVGIPIWALVSAVICWLTTHFDVSQLSAYSAFLILWQIVFGWMIINRFREKFRVGKVLIDCGRAPLYAMFIFQSVWMAGMAISWLLVTGSLVEASFFLSFSVFWICGAASRLQFCEAGIRLHGLLPWSKIKSYQWKEGKAPTLLVQTDARFSWYSRGAYPIPTKYRNEVDAVLQQKLGNPSTEAS